MEKNIKQHIFKILADHLSKFILYLILTILIYFFSIYKGWIVNNEFTLSWLSNNLKDPKSIFTGFCIIILMYLVYAFIRDMDKIFSSDIKSILNAIESGDFTQHLNTKEFNQIQKAFFEKEEQRKRQEKVIKEKDKEINLQLSYLAHDIKSPLTIILSSSQMILKNQTLDEKNSIRLTKIIEQSKHINNYINLLMELLQTGQMKGENTKDSTIDDILQVVTHTVNSFNKNRETKIVILENIPSQKEGVVNIDPVLLEKSILHLLNNAIEYDLENKVEVMLNLNGNNLEISIQDSGKGFVENEIENYKKLFYTSNKGRTSEKGYGVGLYYVDSFMKSINGELLLKNRKNKGGAVVTMKIPVVKKENWQM